MLKGVPTQTGCHGDDDVLNLYKDSVPVKLVVCSRPQMCQVYNQLLTFLLIVSYSGKAVVEFFCLQDLF